MRPKPKSLRLRLSRIRLPTRLKLHPLHQQLRSLSFPPARTPWPLRLLPRFGRRRGAREKIQEFLPEIVSLEERRPPAAASIVLWTIALLLMTGAAWASMVSVDRVVTAQGKIANREFQLRSPS